MCPQRNKTLTRTRFGNDCQQKHVGFIKTIEDSASTSPSIVLIQIFL